MSNSRINRQFSCTHTTLPHFRDGLSLLLHIQPVRPTVRAEGLWSQDRKERRVWMT